MRSREMAGHRATGGRARVAAVALLAAVALFGAACSTAPVVTPGQVMGVAQRVISLEMTGAVS